MVLRITAFVALAIGVIGLTEAPVTSQEKKADAKPRPADQAKAKKALMELQDFIGVWNLEGTMKSGGESKAWKEKVSWGWKFQEGDSWITVDFAEGKGKHFSGGTLRYDVAKKKYVLALTGTDKVEQVFAGDLAKNGILKLERKDPKTGDLDRITMNTLAEGIRFQAKFTRQDGGKGPFSDLFAMNGNKDGESLAGGSKKPECIVSGGAASIPVQHAGKTYYVCCTGCRDEFNANPEKYVKK